MEPRRTISVRLVDREGLDAVRKAAWVAGRRKAALEIVVDYRPPPLRTLVRWRETAPPELRWRVTGSVSADALAAEADAVAKREGVAPAIRVRQLPRRRARWLHARHRFDPRLS
ncbi:MAG: hypothetical protein ABR613_08020 [Actinomycetota bacterium]